MEGEVREPTMAADEVLILHVDDSKNSEDDECLCMGENKAAARLRKERRDKASSDADEPDVSIVSVKVGKTKRKRRANSPKSPSKRVCDPGPFSLVSSEDEDDIKVIDIVSKAENVCGNNSSRPQTNSNKTKRLKPSGNSSSSLNVEKAGTSKSSANDESTSSTNASNKTDLLDSDYLAALRLDRELNSKPTDDSGSSDKDGIFALDAALGKSLQEVKQTPLKKTAKSLKDNVLSQKLPTCWSECPNCPADVFRKYHLIDVVSGSAEWEVVAHPVTLAGFNVTRVRRIQNETLWQRLCFEKQLMLRERADVNEKFLYHSSRARVEVICEEGLDQRVSASMGNFGNGIYFSDDPAKCDRYGAVSQCKAMFCCRVLLGHTKVYPDGVCEKLMREPLKDYPLPNEPKAYDSVQGNLTGQNEFVVYNMYRVMPEYIIDYSRPGGERNDIYTQLVHQAAAIRAATKAYNMQLAAVKKRRKK